MNINLIKSLDIEFNNLDMIPNTANPDIEKIKVKNKKDDDLAKAKDDLPF
ncbi:MAG: hypothetical protein NTY07_10340 [Bacteroidia bacterium]|nr:hypothetical protein [Bacteroidia bacterium]